MNMLGKFKNFPEFLKIRIDLVPIVFGRIDRGDFKITEVLPYLVYGNSTINTMATTLVPMKHKLAALNILERDIGLLLNVKNCTDSPYNGIDNSIKWRISNHSIFVHCPIPPSEEVIEAAKQYVSWKQQFHDVKMELRNTAKEHRENRLTKQYLEARKRFVNVCPDKKSRLYAMIYLTY